MEASREILNDVNSSAKKAIRSGESALNERFGDLQERARETLSTIQERAKEAADTSEEFVKEHPFTTVLGAAAVGFVAGMLINRSRH